MELLLFRMNMIKQFLNVRVELWLDQVRVFWIMGMW